MTTTVSLSISANEGYSPEQVQSELTLGELLEAVELAIADHGEDARIVLDDGQRYGARWGRISTAYGEVEFEETDMEDK